jgi:hypothetical protein
MSYHNNENHHDTGPSANPGLEAGNPCARPAKQLKIG